MSKVRRIGVLTGGGDAPGLNAVIRAVVKSSYNYGIECLGLENSFDGLLETNRHTVLTPRNVTGILRVGGTILGTVNRGNPFLKPIDTTDGPKDYAERCMEMFHKLQIDGIVVIGGDGTLSIAHEFNKKGMPIIGVPKTIDNDIVGTTNCFGFDTAVAFATDAIDRSAHDGAGAPARDGGRGDGPLRRLDRALLGRGRRRRRDHGPRDSRTTSRSSRKRIKERDAFGAKFSIVVVAEGAVPQGGKVSLVKAADGGYVERLGGVGHRVAAELEKLTGKETRTVVLGHLQRGGSPTSFDRMLATRFGAMAVELLVKGESDRMVAFHPPEIGSIPLADVGGKMRLVPADGDVVRTAKSLGISFGDE